MSEKQTSESRHKKNSLSLKAKVIMLLVIPLVVIGVSSAAIVITAKTLVPDDVYNSLVSEEKQYALPLLTGKDEIVNQLTELLLDVQASDTVCIQTGLSLDMDESTLTGTMSDSQKNLIKHMEDPVKEQFRRTYAMMVQDEKTEEYRGVIADYGEKTQLLPDVSVFNTATEAECEQIDNYIKYTLDIPVEAAEAFYGEEHEQQLAKIKTCFEDVFVIRQGSEAEPIRCTVKAKADAQTAELTNIDFEKVYHIHLFVTFMNDYAPLGEQEISFDFTVKHTNTIKYAGIAIADEKITIHKSGYQALSLITNVSDNATKEDYTLTFSSADESICTIDETGTVQAVGKESAEPVMVTATLEYLGNTYTASCPVWVITEADGIKISEAELQIRTGETYVLSASVTPKKATIRDVVWYTTDENICTVDENGTVTGVNEGTAEVIAVSKDGNFMEECHVTVTK